MADLHIKSGFGTCVTTAGRLTAQTGAFGSGSLTAGNVYGSLLLAWTHGAPVSGDRFILSDASSISLADNLYCLATVMSNEYEAISVADANVDQYSAGAQERHDNVQFRGQWKFSGTTITGENGGGWTVSTSGSRVYAHDSHIEPDAGKYLTLSGKATGAYLTGSTIGCGNTTGGVVYVTGGGEFSMIGGAVTAATSFSRLISGGIEGSTYRFQGVDMSVIDDWILYNITGAIGDDKITLEMVDCKISSTLEISNEDFIHPWQEARMIRCYHNNNAAAKYAYRAQVGTAKIEDTDAIYRDADAEFGDTGNIISYRVDTNSTTSAIQPAVFRLPFSVFAQSSGTAENNIKLFFLANYSGATDLDIHFRVRGPDATNFEVANFSSSSGDLISGSDIAVDPFATGTALSTNTEAWSGTLTGLTKYEVNIDSSGGSGGAMIDGPLYIECIITAPSKIFYFSPDPDLS